VTATGREKVLIVPGLNGHPGMLLRAAPELFPTWEPVAFNHHLDDARDGVPGLATRAWAAAGEPSGPIWVCGESFGGTVALTLAHLYPAQVKGLILLSTFGWHPSTLARRGVGALAVWSYLGARVTEPVYRVGRLASLPSQLGLRFSGDLLQSYVERPRADTAAYRTKAELSMTFDARPWLGELHMPAFVMTGTWDPVVPVQAGRELARRLPYATLRSLPGGHLVHLVEAARVGGYIADWRRELR
jgi:pimeloyl-ACP methyl ester carboxylesterase